MSSIQAQKPTSLGEHAIVIGGSIAGLMTARVLSDYFDRVTVFDADTPPDQAVPRKGAPQGNHIHALLSGGTTVIHKYFPDIHQDLIAAGAQYGDAMLNWRIYLGGRWALRIPSGQESYTMSRPLLETKIRKHTLAISNIELVSATPVGGLVSNTAQTKVTGVTLKKTGEAVLADFVVDVSGRGSTASKWLEKLNYTPPKQVDVGIDIGYTTFYVEEPAGYERDWNMLYVTQDMPADTRGAGLFCIEDGRWQITACGYHKDHAPADWPGFLEFLKTHPFPDIYETIKDLKPLGKGIKYNYPHYLRRRYEDLKEFPQQFLVLGDAMCSFNPFYGQGMTVSIKEAEHLDNCLKQCAAKEHNLDDIALPFFKGSAKLVNAAWDSTTVEDFRYAKTKGKRPMGYGLMKWLNSKFMALSSFDQEFSVAFSKVLHLEEPPESLLTFKYLLKAAFAKKIILKKSPPAMINGGNISNPIPLKKNVA